MPFAKFAHRPLLAPPLPRTPHLACRTRLPPRQTTLPHPPTARPRPGEPQANRPVPARQLLFYFEVTVLDQGELGKIGGGFTPRDAKLTRQPG
jgi:hypothetical protein